MTSEQMEQVSFKAWKRIKGIKGRRARHGEVVAWYEATHNDLPADWEFLTLTQQAQFAIAALNGIPHEERHQYVIDRTDRHSQGASKGWQTRRDNADIVRSLKIAKPDVE